METNYPAITFMFQVRICLVSTFCGDYARFINEMQAMMTQF